MDRKGSKNKEFFVWPKGWFSSDPNLLLWARNASRFGPFNLPTVVGQKWPWKEYIKQWILDSNSPCSGSTLVKRDRKNTRRWRTFQGRASSISFILKKAGISLAKRYCVFLILKNKERTILLGRRTCKSLLMQHTKEFVLDLVGHWEPVKMWGRGGVSRWSEQWKRWVIWAAGF